MDEPIAMNDAKPMLEDGVYMCRHCGNVVNRKSNKQWIKSYCDKSDKMVRLMRIKSLSLPDCFIKTK